MATRSSQLERLYREEGPCVWAYLRRRLQDRSQADELLQETFLVAAQRPKDLNHLTSPRGWLIGTARNLLRSHLRNKLRRMTTTLQDDACSAPPTEEDDRLDVMRQAMGQLPEMHREILELRLKDDLAYAEIATALEIPVGTVRSRLHHAVRMIREQIGEDRHATRKMPATNATPAGVEGRKANEA